MKKLLFALLIGLVANVSGQNYFESGLNKIRPLVDTIPVIMMLTDTSTISYYYFQNYKIGDSVFISPSFVSTNPSSPIVLYGYQVIKTETHTDHRSHGDPFYICIGCEQTTITYLNHLKQPLPERLIVWMAVRRKER